MLMRLLLSINGVRYYHYDTKSAEDGYYSFDFAFYDGIKNNHNTLIACLDSWVLSLPSVARQNRLLPESGPLKPYHPIAFNRFFPVLSSSQLNW